MQVPGSGGRKGARKGAVAPTVGPGGSTAAVAPELGEASGCTKASSRHRRPTPAASRFGCGPHSPSALTATEARVRSADPWPPVEGVLVRVCTESELAPVS